MHTPLQAARLVKKSTITHIIPVGGAEPLHHCARSCWCFPLYDSRVATHNAKDLRECRERTNTNRKNEVWVSILEVVA